MWQAVANSGLEYEDWTIRKEYDSGSPYLHLYLELKNGSDSEQARHLLDGSLAALDSDYANVGRMLEVDPLKVTLLPKGSFQRYLEEKRHAGFDLAHLKPPHMNASDDVIESLLRSSNGGPDPGR